MHQPQTLKKIVYVIVGYCLHMLCITQAHAEWTIAAMTGLAEYTTTVADNPTFQYPSNLHTNDISGGITARYLWNVFHPRLALGAESGYLWIAQDATRYGYNTSFSSNSNGIILANLVARWAIVPTVGFAVFAGPAWLNTHYTATILSPDQSASSNAAYQMTADLGIETNWLFKRHWSLGWRWETIFNTSKQSLPMNLESQSSVSVLSANLRYTFAV